MDVGSREFFDGIAPHFGDQYKSSPAFHERMEVWSRAIRQQTARLPEDALCVDAGCGEGILSRVVASEGLRCVGIDQSPQMLELATLEAQRSGLTDRLSYQQGVLPLDDRALDGAADLILCSSVFEYLEDPYGVADCLQRWLRPGATALVSVPNLRSRYRRFERISQRLVGRPRYVRHQRYLEHVPVVKAMFQGAGFGVRDTQYFGIPPFGRAFGRENADDVSTLVLLTLERSRVV